MQNNAKKKGIIGSLYVAAFAVWTLLVCTVDVQPVGVKGTEIGFAAVNTWFHALTGVHLGLYAVTDWLGLVPIGVCLFFAGVGCVQLVRRRRLLKVDADILLLGLYYIAVILCYLLFEARPVNYRPVLIDGRMEASFPSSTVLLVLCVMPSLNGQVRRRVKNEKAIKTICAVSRVFSVFMVVGRLISGVHWLTDIFAALLLSEGLYAIYEAAVLLCGGKET